MSLGPLGLGLNKILPHEPLLGALGGRVKSFGTTVTVRAQTVVPAQIRKDHHITPRTQLEWIDDGETIRAARGLTQGLHRKFLEAREQERQRD